MKIKGLLTLATVALMAGALPVMAEQEVNPREAAAGTWVHVGKTTADFGNDHDSIDIHGNDNFRKLRFKVTDAPLNLQRLVVTYTNGDPDTIAFAQDIPKGGSSRDIDLKGSGTRSIRRVEFWYSTDGKGQGKSDVELEGQR
jgi:hypothetical protein